MEIDKVFNNDVDGVADNLFSAVKNSVSEVKVMQQRKAAENVQLVIQALKKIDSDIRNRFDGVTNAIEKRVASIKDGRDGINGKDGRDGKDGRPGKDGAVGPAGRDGIPGRDGVDGINGVGVTSARIDFDGSLIISLDNGREINVGEVVAPDLAERIKVITNGGGTSQYVLDTLASLQAQITALIPSQTGNSGKYLTTNGTTTSWAAVAGGVASVNGYTGTVVLAQTDISGTASLTTTQTLTNKTLTSPKINEILDANGNEILGLSTTASSTDFLTVKNGIGVGVPLHIYADGSSSNIGLHIQPKGTGLVTISDGADFDKGIRFRSVSSAASAITLIDAVSTAGRVVTLPDATTTLVGRDTTDTLTNKTLTGAAMNGTLGATTPSTVAATTLTTSSTVTHNGGTANGVAYLNGSKVLTTGSALVFDGTNLGVGVTPSAWGSTSKALQFSTGAFEARSASFSSNTNAYFNAGWLYVGTGRATLYNQTDGQHVWYNSASGTAGNAISFTQAMTLDSSGNLLVGRTTTANGGKFVVEQSTAGNWSGVLRQTASTGSLVGLLLTYANQDPNNIGNEFLYCEGNGTNIRMTVRSNGGIANYSANNVNLSDRREKTNFAPAGSYLHKICAIPVQTFNYIDQNMEEDGGLTLGVVAQDVQAVAPELVMESNWASKDEEPKMRLSIYQTDLQYALMKCIQEQQALITQLTARITALESV